MIESLLAGIKAKQFTRDRQKLAERAGSEMKKKRS